jgi:PGF-pre-PGF domain-containing protein
LLILTAVFLLIIISGIGSAAEIIVQPGNSIQSAVDNANSGDTIIIKAGTYTENVNITKGDLTIRSESGNPDDTTIKSRSSTASVLSVQADNVKISGIRAIGASGSSHSGIYIHQCNKCIIENNALTNNGRGIYIENSRKCTVSDNIVTNNRAYGIVLGSASYNVISGNMAYNSSRGIYLGSSDYNTISGNNVTFNDYLGFYECSLCDYNSVYNNYFNNINVTIKTGSGNSYNITKTPGTNIIGGPYIGGNYWGKPDGTGFSDTAVDKDGDGISDSAYGLPGGSKYSDYLPLVYSSNSPEPAPPVADFSSNVISGNAPLDVSFTDKSTGTPVEWNWDFGDGTNSAEQNPVHTYSTAGNYTVSLAVRNENGTHSKSSIITVLQNIEPSDLLPEADFGTNATQGFAPLAVQFTDLSKNTVSWSWDFDNNGQSDSAFQNPVYVYKNPGDYTVNLTVSNVNGTASKTLEIKVLEAEEEKILPGADFNANVTGGYAPLSVLFTDSSQNATGVVWDFDGDGVEDVNSGTVVYVYTSPGTYTVSLTATNANGTNTKAAIINVTRNPDFPVADFSISATGGYAPLSVTFTDISQNTISRSWDVNNDGVEDSNASSFVYEYSSAGSYTAKLTAINAKGRDTKTITIIVDRKSSGGSSSGGGGGGGSPEPAKNVEVKELSQLFITNGKAVKFEFTKNATCVVYVGFDAIKNVGKTTTIVEELKNKSALVSELPEGEVYKSFNVWVGNSGYATSKNIEKPVICFKVEKNWLQDKSIDQNSITLNRYSDKKWEQLPVNLSEEDDKYLYFTAEVPGYSSFAITGKAVQNVKAETSQIPAEKRAIGEVQSEKDETKQTEPDNKSNKNNIVLSAGIVVGALGVIGLMLKGMKK